MGHFHTAARAFAALYSKGFAGMYLEGAQRATIGVFQMAVGGKANAETLDEAAFRLLSCEPRASLHIIHAITDWCKLNHVELKHEYPVKSDTK